MRSVGTPDDEITTRIDVRTVLARKRAAVAAHVSQNPPDLMTAMTGQVLEAMGGFEHFVSAGLTPAAAALRRTGDLAGRGSQ
jgi:LmbE family N-acetylglucosaminyl deacetylase